MNVLVANDDGIQSRGIYELVRALSEKATVYVCAPDGQRSASGHGITVSSSISVEEIEFPNARMAFKISGTPADCVKLGMQLMEERNIKINMVYAGINHGGNLGTDTLYSGTVSAAIEGTICGVPSVAVSVNSHEAEHFGFACELALKVIDNAYGRISSDTVININTPNLPAKEIKGVRYASLGRREYKNEFKAPDECKNGKMIYRYGGEPVIYNGLPNTTDVIAMQEGYATVTPLHRDLTDYGLLDEIRNWRIEK